MFRRNNPFLFPAGALLLAGLSFPAAAQVVNCTASAVPRLARTAGYTEPVGDIVLSCTGGLPTPAGSLVPEINLTLFLNTNVASRVTVHSTAGPDFSEALLLID